MLVSPKSLTEVGHNVLLFNGNQSFLEHIADRR